MSQTKTQELRTSKRYMTNGAAFVTVNGTKTVYSGYLKDISAKGIAFKCDASLPVGTPVDVTIMSGFKSASFSGFVTRFGAYEIVVTCSEKTVGNMVRFYSARAAL